MRRHCEPAAVLPRPAIGVAPKSLFAVGRRIAGRGVDDGKIAHHANLDVMGFEILDRHRLCRLLEKFGAVDQRLVGIGTTEVLGENFVETFHVGILDGIDVIAMRLVSSARSFLMMFPPFIVNNPNVVIPGCAFGRQLPT